MVCASHRRGLTRAEAVVVAGICAVSIGLLLPAVQKARAEGNGKVCQNNLMQIALATLKYHDTFGSFAPGMDDQCVGPLIRLLPFVGRDDLYKNFSFNPTYSLYWLNPYNRPWSDGTDDIPRPPDLYGCEGEVDVFLCPDGPQPDQTVTSFMAAIYGTEGIDYPAAVGHLDTHLFSSSPGRLILARSHYLAMAGDFHYFPPRYRGVFTYNSATQLSDLERGPENTIIYGEYWGGYVDWNHVGGIPSGWSNGSRSAGFNYSTFGTCPSDRPDSPCDFQQSMGLHWATFGALHGKKSNMFNVAMADGSVQSLAGDIDFVTWLTLCSVRDPGGNPVGLRSEEPWAGIDR